MTLARAPRLLMPLLMLVGAVVLIAVLSSGGGSGYRVRMELGTASGLREGSAVKIAGATIGNVDTLRLDDHDRVQVELRLKDGQSVNRGVRVAIRSANLLGEKYVDLQSPRGAPPLPSGTDVAASRVSLPVDLDQALSTLDADTRTRLAILVNETGLALTGRRVDLSRTLSQLPPAFDAVTQLLQDVGSDNGSLGRLVDRSSGFVRRLTQERRQLTRLVDMAGQGLSTVAARRASLRDMLRRAPGTLQSLRALLGDLRRTTVPLKPAAQALAATAPGLRSTLAQLEPFRRAAAPTLAQAQNAAPLLSKLGHDATPAVRRGVPTVRALATFAEGAAPATKTLDTSVDDLLGTVQGWARAIQGRDSIGHLFRGHLDVGPEAMKSLLERMVPKAPARQGAGKKQDGGAPPSPGGTGAAATATAPAAGAAPLKLSDLLPKQPLLPREKLPKAVGDVLDRLLPQPGKGQAAPTPAAAATLLDFLLGR